ncbi:hypothetical protein ABZX85_23040 [Streptomyces sp. NPDC004539]|uniref:hypothetical protein n=1 Tax=Streptomyces sp. NPDC004539 TaxID=3154280 RepID=UPI0033ADC1C6
MNHDPERWAALGRAIRDDRERQGLGRDQLVERIRERGARVTARTIGSIERGVVPKSKDKPPSLEPVVAALGWQIGWTDRILAGEDPALVLGVGATEAPAVDPPRARLLELVPFVYEFSRTAVALGAAPGLRDEFDSLVQRLTDAVGAGPPRRPAFALAAYRPHGAAEGVPADDAARIRDALNSDS